MRALIIVLALLLPSIVASAEDKPVTLKLSTWVPPAQPLNPAFTEWAKDLEKESGGSIKSTLFPSEQLGKAFDHYDMTRDGIADFAYINPGYQPGRFPVAAGAELPFLISNAKSGSVAVDTWYRRYAEREMKDIRVCLTFLIDPSTLHAKKKILLPEDVRGLKVRPANATLGAFMTLLGGTNVQASAPEAREMLDRGVANAITFPWGSLILFGIDKTVKYHADMVFWTGPFMWGMNKAKYESLSAGQKLAVDHHCTPEWAEKVGAAWADFEHAGLAKVMAMPDHEIYKLTPEQIAAWRQSAEPLKVKWSAQVKAAGFDPDEVYGGLIAELKKNGALAE